MRGTDNARTGGAILVDKLSIHGVRHVFCVPGESYLGALDAFHDSTITLTVCRHESGAAMMAEAVGKTTGLSGLCFVTRGRGATNASAGIHIARQDSSPVSMFVGQVSRQMRDREAFQELDYRAVFGSVAKWATEIDDPARIPEIVSRAFHTACNGRPGPVVVALPEDMLHERLAVQDATAFTPAETSPGAAEMKRLQEMLTSAERPIALLGGSRWSETACEAFARFAERFALPVATTFRRQYLFDNLHACYAGDLGIGPNPKLLARVKAADMVLLIGGRMSEMSSQGYTLFDIPEPRMKLVHVHPGAEELGRVYHPTLAIHAAPPAFCAPLEPRGGSPAAAERDSLERRGGRRARRLSHLDGQGDAGAGPSQSRRDCGLATRKSAGGCDYRQRGGKFCRLDPSLLPLPQIRHPRGADLRFDGLRVPGGGGDEAAASRPARRVRCRRRRFPYDRPGFRNCGAIQIAGNRGSRRQQPLWHHPHASRARLSRPRGCHLTDQSGFRRVCLGVPRLWRDRREDRRFPSRLRRRAAVRQAGDHPSADRSGSNYASGDAERHSGKGTRGR